VTTNYYLVSIKPASKGVNVDGASISLVYTATDAAGDPADLCTKVSAALTTLATGQVHTLSSYFAPSIDRTSNSARINCYNITGHLDGSPHGSPVFFVNWTPSSALDSTAQAEGLAVVVGLEAAYGSDVEFGPSAALPTPPDIVADFGAASTHTGHTRPRARDRGKNWWGPLTTSALAYDGTNFQQVVSATCAADFQAAYGKTLVQPVLTSGTAQLGVWSRRNVSVKPATIMRVDRRPGYQRRRVDPMGYLVTQAIPY